MQGQKGGHPAPVLLDGDEKGGDERKVAAATTPGLAVTKRGAREVSDPNEPAEKEADANSEEVAGDLCRRRQAAATRARTARQESRRRRRSRRQDGREERRWQGRQPAMRKEGGDKKGDDKKGDDAKGKGGSAYQRQARIARSGPTSSGTPSLAAAGTLQWPTSQSTFPLIWRGGVSHPGRWSRRRTATSRFRWHRW